MKFPAFGFALLLCPSLLFASPFSAAPEETREEFHKYCDYIVAEKTNNKVIFIGGYYMRDLVAGYHIFGEKKYLDTAIAYADKLVKKQSPRGYWLTGYAPNTYLADTGSAIGLFISLYHEVDKERQAQYFNAIQRYVDAIKKDDLIRPSGALDVGLRGDGTNAAVAPYREDYTISSALTGGEVYTWMYHTTKMEEYRQVAYGALNWVLGTMRQDGVIPYNHPAGKSDLTVHGNKDNDHLLWEHSPYLTSAYVGEGLLSFDLYCDQSDWRRQLRAKIKPHIEYLLRTQNTNGTWAVDILWDQKRSPGIINTLVWYYTQVEQDPRIIAAVRKFEAYIRVPENAKTFGLLNAGANLDGKNRVDYDCVTALTGRALADIIQPGVDSRW